MLVVGGRCRHHLLVDILCGTLVLEGDVGDHVAFGSGLSDGRPERFQGMSDGVVDGGRLVAAMGHAVGAFFIIAGAVFVPVRGFHQFLEGRGETLAQEIAGALPAEDIAGRVAPGRAVILLIAGEEIEIERRVAELPALAVAEPEDRAEQFFGLFPVQEVFLIGRPFIGIARRDGDAFDVQIVGHVVEERTDFVRGDAIEQGGVDVDAKAAGAQKPDRVDRLCRTRPPGRRSDRDAPSDHRDGWRTSDKRLGLKSSIFFFTSTALVQR